MNLYLKRALLVVMCLAILLPSFCFAAPSATLTSITGAVVTVSDLEALYDGKKKSATVTVTLDGKTLAAGTDYVVSGNRTPSAKIGKYPLTITVTGVGMYTDSVTKQVTFSISKKIEVSRLKKRLTYDVSFKRLKTNRVTLITKLKGKETKMTVLKVPAGFKVTRNSRIKLAKGTKKGIYTVKLRLTTGDTSKIVTVKIRVK